MTNLACGVCYTLYQMGARDEIEDAVTIIAATAVCPDHVNTASVFLSNFKSEIQRLKGGKCVD